MDERAASEQAIFLPTCDMVHLNGSIGENNGGPVKARLRYAYSLWQTHSINTGAWPAMCRRYATSECIKITLALKCTLSLPRWTS